MDQKSLYEIQAGDESIIMLDNDAALIGRDQFVIDHISAQIGDRSACFNAVELSIGEGRLSQLILESFKSMKLNCADISKSRINHVKKILEGNPRVNIENTTFTECNFDTHFNLIETSIYNIVIAIDIMEHVLDVFGFVENCQRILAWDGVLLIRVPNVAYVKHRVRLLTGKLPITASWFGSSDSYDAWREQHGWDGNHLHLFTIPALKKLLRESGFIIEKCRDPGARFSFIRDLWPNLMYSNPLIVARKVKK